MKLTDGLILLISFGVAVVAGGLLVEVGVEELLAAAAVPIVATALTGVAVGVRDRVFGWKF